MKIISNLSAVGSIIAFLVPHFYNGSNQTNTFQYGSLVVFVLISSIIIFYEFRNRAKTYDNEDKIEEYMYEWISKTGRSVIFTRDMSWCKSERSKELLSNKAKRKELIVLMSEKTDFSEKLDKEGADVHYYDSLTAHRPNSRFTIIHYGRGDAKFAVGRTDNKGKRRIEEFEKGIHPQFDIAEDLVNIIINKK